MSCYGTAPSGCCGPTRGAGDAELTTPSRSLEVELLYLDRLLCERCRGTEEVLRDAVEQAGTILGPTGVDLSLKLTHVTSEEQARALGFISSPTLRLMGRDAAVEVKESLCTGCGTLGGCDILCRVWTWRGKDYSVPPKAMLLDAILRDAYLHPDGKRLAPAPLNELPENLKRFFRGALPREK